MFGRPRKKTALWYKHDNNMRKDDRIIDLRRRYGLGGYAIYNMLIEVLIDTDFYAYEYNEQSAEELSKDFGISKEKLIEIINYCINDKLFFIQDGFLRNKTLEDRFMALDMKRNRDRQRISTQTELPIKVKPKKVNNKPLEDKFNEFWSLYPSKRRSKKEECKKKFISKSKNITGSDRAILALKKYIASRDFAKDNYEFMQLSITWINGWDLDTWLSMEDEKVTSNYKKLEV